MHVTKSLTRPARAHNSEAMISPDNLNRIADLPGVIGILQRGAHGVISAGEDGDHHLTQQTGDYAGESTAKPTLLAALDLYARAIDLLGLDVPVTVIFDPTPASLRFFSAGVGDSHVVVACERAHGVNKSIQRVIRGAMSRGR